MIYLEDKEILPFLCDSINYIQYFNFFLIRRNRNLITPIMWACSLQTAQRTLKILGGSILYLNSWQHESVLASEMNANAAQSPLDIVQKQVLTSMLYVPSHESRLLIFTEFDFKHCKYTEFRTGHRMHVHYNCCNETNYMFEKENEMIDSHSS